VSKTTDPYIQALTNRETSVPTTNEKVAGDAPAAAEPERKKREYKDMEHGEKDENLHAKVDMNTVCRFSQSHSVIR
jgi:hypothetical protein